MVEKYTNERKRKKLDILMYIGCLIIVLMEFVDM